MNHNIKISKRMEKCVTQWHRIGISINSNTKPPQYCCFASPEIAKHLFQEIEINERYFVIIHLFLLVKISKSHLGTFQT